MDKIPKGICSKCHCDFFQCKCSQFYPNIGNAENNFLFARVYAALNESYPELATEFFNAYKPIKK